MRTGGLQVDSGAAQLLKVASAGPKPERVVSGFRQATAAGESDAPKIRARPKGLLAPWMVDLRTGGLQVDSGAAQLLKVASAGPKPERVVSGFRQATAAGESDAPKIRARPKGLLAPWMVRA